MTKYEPAFKFAQYNVFMTDLFFQPYGEVDSFVTIKNGKWEFFVSEEAIRKLSERGYDCALQETFFKNFEIKSLDLGREVTNLNSKKVEEMNNEEFLIFLDKLFALGKRFAEEYKKTEFLYFKKIEKELNEQLGEKNSFQDLLSENLNLASWPEKERKLADYIMSMQHLKFELRKVINDVLMGPNAICTKILNEIIKRTGREDAVEMTLEEVKDCMNGKLVKDIYERHVYSFITFKDGGLNIISGGDAYRKIRELEKEIPTNEVIGTPAFKGLVKGKAKIIPLSLNPKEYLSKLETGDILVSDTTGPEMMPIIEKAAAIVTDEGGMMSHAAIVAREFQIPCVVGTNYATEVFKDGDLIEVNAYNGVVRRLTNEPSEGS